MADDKDKKEDDPRTIPMQRPEPEADQDEPKDDPDYINPVVDRLTYMAADVASEVGQEAADEYWAWCDRWMHHRNDED